MIYCKERHTCANCGKRRDCLVVATWTRAQVRTARKLCGPCIKALPGPNQHTRRPSGSRE